MMSRKLKDTDKVVDLNARIEERARELHKVWPVCWWAAHHGFGRFICVQYAERLMGTLLWYTDDGR
eukprot:scaffold665426_cov59-Prasinocladus_malaysianus.AAC.1